MKKFLVILLFLISFIFILPVTVLIIIIKYSSRGQNDSLIKEIEENLNTSVERKGKASESADYSKKGSKAISEEIEEKLSGRQEKIIKLIQKKGEVDMAIISSIIKNVSERTLRRDLAKLENLGLIVKLGETKGATYRLKK
ncbi:MAG: hypothetical protein Kow0081_4240 [Candidatus Dojkabacteria bacterium]